MKDSFVVRTEWLDAVQYMSHDEAGVLFKMMLNYESEKPLDDGIPDFDNYNEAYIAFMFIRRALDRSDKKYEEALEKQREAGKKGAEKRWGTNKKQESEDSVPMQENRVPIATPTEPSRVPMGSDAISELDSELDSDIEKKKEKKKSRFAPPSLEEVTEYCRERNNNVDPQQFIDFYSSKGWKVGNQPMKDWKACVRTWERREKTRAGTRGKPNPFNQMMQTDYDMKSIEEAILA